MPKGEIEHGEDPEAAARRQVKEELGVQVDQPLTPLGEMRQAGGTRHGWSWRRERRGEARWSRRLAFNSAVAAISA
ncbi:NUDIX domain-containing protein [Sphingomonas aerolata]|uniref:NUDIX domain-containing protein n=1 Tax=Sphingomonas aerolata TaxID=185951 RepID=UPI002FE13FF2